MNTSTNFLKRKEVLLRGSYKVALLGIVGIFSQISTIVIGVFLVRYFTQEVYGTFRQASLIVSTIAFIVTLNIPSSLLYFYPNLSIGEKKGLFLQTIIILTMLGLAGTVSVFFFSDYISLKFSNPALKQILPFFSPYVFFQVVVSFVAAMLMGLDKYKEASVVQIIIPFGNLFVIVTGILFEANLLMLMQIITLYMGVQAVVFVLYSFLQYKGIKAKWNKQFICKQLAYSIPLGISGLIWFSGKEIDKYFLAVFFSPSIFALYVVGALEIPMFRDISTAISSVLIPQISGLYNEKKKKIILTLWKEVIRKSMLIFLPSFGLLYILSESLIAVVYTEKYIDAAVVFKIYLLMICLRIFNPQIIILGVGKTRILFINSIVFVIVNIGLNFWFLRVLKLGITGPAISTIISYMAITSIAMIMACRYLEISFKKLFPFKDFFKISSTTLISSLVTIFLFSLIKDYFLKSFVYGISFICIYLFVSWLLRVFTEDDINLIKEQIKITCNRFSIFN